MGFSNTDQAPLDQLISFRGADQLGLGPVLYKWAGRACVSLVGPAQNVFLRGGLL